MKQITILLFILFSCSETNLDDCDYKSYFNTISKALSDKYSTENLKGVNELFKDAINSVQFSYAKDLEEALEVSIKVKDYEFSRTIVKKLLEGGIPIEYFKRYKDTIEEKYWKGIISEYSSLGKKEILSKQKIKKELIDLRLRDSLFNIEFHKFRKGEKLLTLNYLIDESQGIYQDFRSLVNDFGFPSEINTGYFYYDNEIQNSPLEVILIHIHQLGEPIIRNEFTYEELICNGHLNDYQYTLLNKINSFGGGRGNKHEMQLFYEEHKKSN